MSAVMEQIVPESPATSPRLAFLRERGMGATVLVSALSSAFGVVLLAATGVIGSLSRAVFGPSETVVVVVGIMSGILIGVAMYVGAIVTANTFQTIVAGRVRRIALMRLIGATARSERGRVAGQGLATGAIGAAVGLAAGLVLSAGGARIAEEMSGMPVAGDAMTAAMLLPPVAVALTTWAGAWSGSRRVLAVTPLEALGGSVERTHEQAGSGRRGRNAAAAVIGGVGLVLLGLGIALGLVTPLGVFVAFFGGLLSFTGLVMAATAVMPPVLRLVGRAFGGSVTARLAAENALRHPERSSRMAIGVVVGVTLVTMFAVASASLEAVLYAGYTVAEREAYGMTTFLDAFTAIMMGLVGFSAVIAAIGLVNLLTIGVVQRRRELGLLRALGLSSAQIRTVVLLEAAHITIASTLLGLVLGVVYGWAGAQSMAGSLPDGGVFIAPAIPWGAVAIVAACAAILTLAASVGPTRLATRISPVQALAAE